jgi:hypothetical protein
LGRPCGLAGHEGRHGRVGWLSACPGAGAGADVGGYGDAGREGRVRDGQARLPPRTAYAAAPAAGPELPLPWQSRPPRRTAMALARAKTTGPLCSALGISRSPVELPRPAARRRPPAQACAPGHGTVHCGRAHGGGSCHAGPLLVGHLLGGGQRRWNVQWAAATTRSTQKRAPTPSWMTLKVGFD